MIVSLFGGEVYEYIGGPRDGGRSLVRSRSTAPFQLRVEASGGTYVAGVFMDRAGDIHRVLLWEQDWQEENAQ